MIDLYKEVKEKRQATPKQLVALEKAREARKRKKEEMFQKDPPKESLEIKEIEPIGKKLHTIDEDEEPPKWFKRFISQKVEERLAGLQKNKQKLKPSEPLNDLPTPPKLQEKENTETKAEPIQEPVKEPVTEPLKELVNETPSKPTSTFLPPLAPRKNISSRRGSIFNK